MTFQKKVWYTKTKIQGAFGHWKVVDHHTSLSPPFIFSWCDGEHPLFRWWLCRFSLNSQNMWQLGPIIFKLALSGQHIPNEFTIQLLRSTYQLLWGRPIYPLQRFKSHRICKNIALIAILYYLYAKELQGLFLALAHSWLHPSGLFVKNFVDDPVASNPPVSKNFISLLEVDEKHPERQWERNSIE